MYQQTTISQIMIFAPRSSPRGLMLYFSVCGIILLGLCDTVWSGDILVCRGVSDAGVVNTSDKEMSGKINALEEKVRQLQKLVDSGNATARHSTIEGLPRDCSELYAAGVTVDGVYAISPDGRCPFHVYCDMAGGGWTLIQKRIDGHVSFYRSWTEYAQGFGHIDSEHWLGLDKIHRLTADGSEIYFHFEYYDGTAGFAHYQAFTVQGATAAYRMNVDAFGYNGTIDELFSFHNNMKFSTYDRDNDAYPTNCCKDILDGGGWWYKNCYRIGNMNGVFGKRETGGIGYWTTKNIPLKTVNIKIKPSPGYC